jgi:hypothetical protein
MNRFRSTCLICALAVGGGVALFAIKPRLSPTQQEPPLVQLAVPPGAFDMGEIWEAEEFRWVVQVENREIFSVEVEGFSTSCNCAAVEPQSFVLEPGERREIRLKVDLTAKLASNPDDEVSVQVRPRLKAGADGAVRKGPEWKISGRVRRALALASSAHVGRHSELAQPIPPHSVSFDVLVPLESLSVACDVPGFSASVDLAQPGGKVSVLRLVETSARPVGEFEGVVSLKPILKGGIPLPTRRLRVAGVIVPDVEPDPPAVLVGGRRLNETFEECVSVRSLTGRSVTVVRAEAEGEGLSVVSIEGGRYRIRQTVRRSGTQTNHVRFTVEASGSGQTVELPVTYTGVVAE